MRHQYLRDYVLTTVVLILTKKKRRKKRSNFSNRSTPLREREMSLELECQRKAKKKTQVLNLRNCSWKHLALDDESTAPTLWMKPQSEWGTFQCECEWQLYVCKCLKRACKYWLRRAGFRFAYAAFDRPAYAKRISPGWTCNARWCWTLSDAVFLLLLFRFSFSL